MDFGPGFFSAGFLRFLSLRDFTISYLAMDNYGDVIYLSLLSDWDLEAAFLSCAADTLRLKVDILSTASSK